MKTEPSWRGWTDILLVFVYVAAIITANGLVTEFGQAALPYTAVLLIPFDLVVRDLLQDRMQHRSAWDIRLRMGLLIFGGSTISYLTTVGSFRVAAASFVAFSVTGVLDAITYQKMVAWGRLVRINLATLLAAITDSVVFVVIAFDTVEGGLVAWQVAAKVAGGLVWSLLLFRFFRRRAR